MVMIICYHNYFDIPFAVGPHTTWISDAQFALTCDALGMAGIEKQVFRRFGFKGSGRKDFFRRYAGRNVHITKWLVFFGSLMSTPIIQSATAVRF